MTSDKPDFDVLPPTLGALVKELVEGPKSVSTLDSIAHSYHLYGPRGRGRPRTKARRHESLRLLWRHLGRGCVQLTEAPFGSLQWHDPTVALTASGLYRIRFLLQCLDGIDDSNAWPQDVGGTDDND